jgi:hypothetical protein
MVTFSVKPDATPEEVRAVVDDDQGGQIFSQAVGFIPVICQSVSEPFISS